eukprot:scaffold1650_cov135-Cylindrotheca_fusiformis.AAC.9
MAPQTRMYAEADVRAVSSSDALLAVGENWCLANTSATVSGNRCLFFNFNPLHFLGSAKEAASDI